MIKPEDFKHVVLGFDSNEKPAMKSYENEAVGPVLPGEIRRVFAMPIISMCGLYFRIPPSIAKHFSLIELKGSRLSVFAGPGEVPAEVFAYDGDTERDGGVHWAEIPLDIGIIPGGGLAMLVVRNNSFEPVRFQAVIFGIALTPDWKMR